VSAPTPPPEESFPHPQIPDDAYRRMTLVLRAGLLTSLAILAIGLAAYLLAHPGASSASAISSNPIAPYLTAGGLAHGLATGVPDAYLALGIFVLVATPLVRVATGIYYFRRGHEREMVVITSVVLVLLILGILVIGPLIR